jgi:hypothetical protein
MTPTVQQLSELEVVDLPKCGRCAFRGRRPENVSFLKKPVFEDRLTELYTRKTWARASFRVRWWRRYQ